MPQRPGFGGVGSGWTVGQSWRKGFFFLVCSLSSSFKLLIEDERTVKSLNVFCPHRQIGRAHV